MKQLFITILCALSLIIAQEDAEQMKWQKEIDQQVWKPFIESYEAYDHKTFNALHTDDILRVSAWAIRVGSEYKDRVTSGYQRNKDRGDSRQIDLWFELRKAKKDIAYEVGYYRVKTMVEGKKEDISHARFHVVLKRINGRWKVAQDWDTNNINGHKVNAEDFAMKPIVRF